MEILGCVRTGPTTQEMAQKYSRGRERVLKGRIQPGFTTLIRLLAGDSHGRETTCTQAFCTPLPTLFSPLLGHRSAPPRAFKRREEVMG